jgi:hypothetical protein
MKRRKEDDNDAEKESDSSHRDYLLFIPPLFFGQKKITLPSSRRRASRFKEGILTFGSSSSRAFLSSSENSGVLRDSSPITVAGAASAFHGLPLLLNLSFPCIDEIRPYVNSGCKRKAAFPRVVRKQPFQREWIRGDRRNLS